MTTAEIAPTEHFINFLMQPRIDTSFTMFRVGLTEENAAERVAQFESIEKYVLTHGTAVNKLEMKMAKINFYVMMHASSGDLPNQIITQAERAGSYDHIVRAKSVLVSRLAYREEYGEAAKKLDEMLEDAQKIEDSTKKSRRIFYILSEKQKLSGREGYGKKKVADKIPFMESAIAQGKALLSRRDDPEFAAVDPYYWAEVAETTANLMIEYSKTRAGKKQVNLDEIKAYLSQAQAEMQKSSGMGMDGHVLGDQMFDLYGTLVGRRAEVLALEYKRAFKKSTTEQREQKKTEIVALFDETEKFALENHMLQLEDTLYTTAAMVFIDDIPDQERATSYIQKELNWIRQHPDDTQESVKAIENAKTSYKNKFNVDFVPTLANPPEQP